MRAFCAAVSLVNGGNGGRDMMTSAFGCGEDCIATFRRVDGALPIAR
jgi:hypothetical protein